MIFVGNEIDPKLKWGIIGNFIKENLPNINSFLKSVDKTDFAAIINFYSPQVDKIIKEVEKNYGCRFGAGKFFISAIDEDLYVLRTVLYFIDGNQKYYECKSESAVQHISYLTDESKAELMEKKEVSFDIEPPK